MDALVTSLDFINTKNKKSLIREWYDTYKFINSFIKEYFKEKQVELNLLNYGDNKIIYLIKSDDNYYTITISQPALEYGTIKKEYNNLKNLSRLSKDSVLKPSYYYTDGNKELYLSDYSYDSRIIIRKNNNWGICINEDNNKFEKFSHLEENMVNICMIATIVKLYNHNKNSGLCNCNLSKGDFILKKEWSTNNKTLQNTIDNIRLITARDTIAISFKDYLNLIRRQLISNKSSDNIIINNSERNLMNSETIENGIKLGMELGK